jgi:hypothetical protein
MCRARWDTGSSSDPDACLDVIYRGKTKAVDLIRISGDVEVWCVNTLGIGLDGWANHYASTFSRPQGKALYILGVLKAVANFRGSGMKIESRKARWLLAMIAGPAAGRWRRPSTEGLKISQSHGPTRRYLSSQYSTRVPSHVSG